ncbi:hypothetical protein IW140_005837 [Coemansia sp. RSA 1813]|nr:hypothetical protein LPJ74_002855 [Coemansia sp. RSA 1843]KAJ2088846.1 hypothetical protein IW138_003918 [Coemansia sp. RSA 986]KAJ2211144.1 hypothetical protein EV179_005723 [Coemansia sp. RSA 487]KAJ2564203.1 hypothetical protein IW140_005837 [Coemansia sp. RSA 1813]
MFNELGDVWGYYACEFDYEIIAPKERKQEGHIKMNLHSDDDILPPVDDDEYTTQAPEEEDNEAMECADKDQEYEEILPPEDEH